MEKNIMQFQEGLRLLMHWVKGHATNPFNNRCDELATAAADGKDLDIDVWYEENEYEKK
ncbi:MAG: hypothetical protein WDM90_23515 [Ferruginibacter sp.]